MLSLREALRSHQRAARDLGSSGRSRARRAGDRHGPGHVGGSTSSRSVSGSAAGVLQTYIERVMGLGFMTAQAQMRFWFGVLVFFGLGLLGGAVLAAVDLLMLRPQPAESKVSGSV